MRLVGSATTPGLRPRVKFDRKCRYAKQCIEASWFVGFVLQVMHDLIRSGLTYPFHCLGWTNCRWITAEILIEQI